MYTADVVWLYEYKCDIAIQISQEHIF